MHRAPWRCRWSTSPTRVTSWRATTSLCGAGGHALIETYGNERGSSCCRRPKTISANAVFAGWLIWFIFSKAPFLRFPLNIFFNWSRPILLQVKVFSLTPLILSENRLMQNCNFPNIPMKAVFTLNNSVDTSTSILIQHDHVKFIFMVLNFTPLSTLKEWAL